MRKLGWQAFFGTTEEYRELRELILDNQGNIKPKYIGMDGYASFANTHFEGDMQKTYKNISAVLDKELMRKLGWQQFQGTTEEYKKLRELILDNQGNIKPKYIGMDGYASFANTHFKGDMQKTYKNISAVLDKELMRKLGWQAFQGTTEEYRGLRELILDNQGNIKPEYIGMDGYASFANTHFEGDMQKTYSNISAVLGGVKATRALGLQWKSFQGTTSQFYALKELFKRYGVEQLRGSDGQKKVAREIFKGNRQRTYHNVSILREELLGSKTAFNELKWQRTGKN